VLARGVRSAPGLMVVPAWTELLLAIVSRYHPAAGRAVVGVAELAGSGLRLPSRTHDPSLHDALTIALSEAGVCLRLGRPAGTIQDTIVEVGSDPQSWAALPASQIAETSSTRVRAIPIDPPITITGSVIVPSGTASHVARCAVAAFRDGTAS
jgi:hypothetical protein